MYTARAWLKNGGVEFDLRDVRVYVPTEPELVTEEVLIGREIINDGFKILSLNSEERMVSLNLRR